jgi:hypothetical protein
MRGRLALRHMALVALLSHALFVDAVSTARAQRADREALFDRAGPGARARTRDDGSIALLFGARLRIATEGDPASRALAVATRYAAALGVPRGAELRVERSASWHGFTIVRLRRFDRGRAVIGGSLIVRSLPDGTIDLVVSQPGPTRGASAPTTVDRERAIAIGSQLGIAGAGAQVVDPIEVALAIPARDAIVVAWQIDLHGASLAARARALVDAHDGTVIAAWPLAHDARGRVFETNPVTAAGATIEVDLPRLLDAEHLRGEAFDVASCNAVATGGCARAPLATADGEGNFFYDPAPTSFDDPFSEVSAYHHLSRGAEHFRRAHGFEWRCATATSSATSMEVVVNFSELPGVPHENATFQPASGGDCGRLIFGQGSAIDYAYDGDVVYHELGHAVTDQVVGIIGFTSDALGVSYEPFAISEGTSDYYAATIQGSSTIAESFITLAGTPSGHGSLRDIDDDASCPGSLSGEGHLDGTLWSGLGWDLRSALGAEIADAMVFTTVASMTESPSLAQAGDLLIATALGMRAMGRIDDAAVAAVEAAVEARGLPGCRRIVPLDGGRIAEGWSGTEGLTGNLGQSIAPVHYRIDVPADATALRLRVAPRTANGIYALHLRGGLPVGVDAERTYAAARIPVESGEVLLDASSALALPRCSTLYIAIESTDLQTRGQSLYRIEAVLERSGDPGARCPSRPSDAGTLDPASDAGAAEDAGVMPASTSSGCGCAVEHRPPSAGALCVVAAVLLLGRRSRRARR